MSPTSGPLSSPLFNTPARSQAVRAFMLFVLVLALLIPVLFV